jgi:hypothetical protein
MRGNIRVVAAVVLASGIATAVALPALIGDHGLRPVVGAPGAAGHQTVRLQGSASDARHPHRGGRAAAPRPKQHVTAPEALAAVGLVRTAAPRWTVVSPAASRPRRPAPHPASPAPEPTPVPASPTAPSPTSQPAPAQPAAPATQQVQNRELAAQPQPAPTPPVSPPAAPTPEPAPTPSPPVTPPSPADNRPSADDRIAREEAERARDKRLADPRASARDR